MPDHNALHGHHLALMRAALAAASPRGARVAVDLACGAGGKTAWLAGLCAPGALVVGVDRDLSALRQAPGGVWLAADAHALPLRPGVVELTWCVASLGLFADGGRALTEVARALVPGGALVVVAASERWVRPRRWPDLAIARAAGPGPADDLGADLRAALAAAGLQGVTLAAYLLDPPGLAPLEALLPLADLAPVAPLAIGEPETRPVLLVAAGRSRL